MPRLFPLFALLFILGACAPFSVASTPTRADTLGVVDTPNPKRLKIGPQTGQLAPDFRLEDETGVVTRLSDYRGKPVLLNFWATWCGPCREEMPAFQRLHTEIPGRLTVLAVDVDESRTLVTKFIEELGITFSTPIDRRSAVARAYGFLGLPATFFIDAEGVVRSVKLGPVLEADIQKGLRAVGL